MKEKVYMGPRISSIKLSMTNEECSSGRKIDIVWTTMPKLEFAIGEVSDPPNQRQHTHFFGDKLKTAKNVK
ncbi:719_t:CDS:2 [Entrophospora sp. SA101]|nr:719_t:CDS:2 [Entrophospora sp. SA101]